MPCTANFQRKRRRAIGFLFLSFASEKLPSRSRFFLILDQCGMPLSTASEYDLNTRLRFVTAVRAELAIGIRNLLIAFGTFVR
jgi:hypothetical protein